MSSNPTFLGTVASDEVEGVDVSREADGSVVLWEPGTGHLLRFPPASLGALRELLDRAAMPGQAEAHPQ